MSKWISVKDKLPADCINVLTFSEIWNYQLAQIDFFTNDIKAWYRKGGGFIGAVNSENVTHWMPLPEMPELPSSILTN